MKYGTVIDDEMVTLVYETDALEAMAKERARAKAAEAYIERIRNALGGYADSDLVSLAETLKARDDALEAEVERLRDEVQRCNHELAQAKLTAKDDARTIQFVISQRDAANAEARRMAAGYCRCSDDEACQWLRERDEARAENERLREKVAALRTVLVLARQYVVKGNEMGAYTGCVTSGETVLARIDLASNHNQDATGG